VIGKRLNDMIDIVVIYWRLSYVCDCAEGKTNNGYFDIRGYNKMYGLLKHVFTL